MEAVVQHELGVELSSIAQQVLTDPRDPYNRQPCAVEDLHPVPELRAR
jgi:hypothetical protein